jgi:hypothetical protein
MESFRQHIVRRIAEDAEWIRMNLPASNTEYFKMCEQLKYVANNTWQSPIETYLYGGDCEDLVTFQLAFALANEGFGWKIGFIVFYPEIVIPGISTGHMAMIFEDEKIETVFVYDIAFAGLRVPVALDFYLRKYVQAEKEEDALNQAKYYRMWYMFEKNDFNQPPLKILPGMTP